MTCDVIAPQTHPTFSKENLSPSGNTTSFTTALGVSSPAYSVECLTSPSASSRSPLLHRTRSVTPRYVRSRGCILCVQWGGSVIRGMPCSTVNVIASKAAAHHLPDLSSALGCDDLARNMNVGNSRFIHVPDRGLCEGVFPQ